MSDNVIEGEATEVDEGALVPALPSLPEPPRATAMVVRDELSVDDIVRQMEIIEQAMHRVMKPNVHYGVIPGTNKPTLLQPGAQKLNVLFRLAPSFRTERTWHEDGHLTVVSTCLLTHITTGTLVATGDGLCSTKEKRYAKRKASRTCPECGEPQIKKSKFAPKQGDYPGASPADPPGWYCWRKEGGCGTNFPASDPRIVEQLEGEVDNPDVADLYNTVLKMANKRALVAATINGTAASDMFTQDVEDLPADQLQGREEAKPAGGDQTPPTVQPAYDAWVAPTSPTELMTRLGAVMGDTDAAREWVAEALADKHEVGSLSDLSAESRNAFLVLVARVLRDLESDAQANGDLAFRQRGVRDLISESFGRHLGSGVDGPGWRLDPSETTWPIKGADVETAVADETMASEDAPGGSRESGPTAEPPRAADPVEEPHPQDDIPF